MLYVRRSKKLMTKRSRYSCSLVGMLAAVCLLTGSADKYHAQSRAPRNDSPPVSGFRVKAVLMSLESAKAGKTVCVHGDGRLYVRDWTKRGTGGSWMNVSPQEVLDLLLEFYVADFFRLSSSYGESQPGSAPIHLEMFKWRWSGFLPRLSRPCLCE
jgi:hypothetical protein